MSFNTIPENKILAKVYEFTVINQFQFGMLYAMTEQYDNQ